jgi:hypothetical protein
MAPGRSNPCRSHRQPAIESEMTPGRALTMPRSPTPESPSGHRIFRTAFASVYPLYVTKAERKGRTKDEVDQVICWLTGYDGPGLQQQIEHQSDFAAFFANAPCMNPRCDLITGVVCGVRVEQVEDPLMKKIRQLDKLVDELAKGRAMAKVLRS